MTDELDEGLLDEVSQSALWSQKVDLRRRKQRQKDKEEEEEWRMKIETERD